MGSGLNGLIVKGGEQRAGHDNVGIVSRSLGASCGAARMAVGEQGGWRWYVCRLASCERWAWGGF
jgi:hypothetical protein